MIPRRFSVSSDSAELSAWPKTIFTINEDCTFLPDLSPFDICLLSLHKLWSYWWFQRLGQVTWVKLGSDFCFPLTFDCICGETGTAVMKGNYCYSIFATITQKSSKWKKQENREASGNVERLDRKSSVMACGCGTWLYTKSHRTTSVGKDQLHKD